MQSGVFSFSKAIDTFCPIGPWIVTKDEMPDPQALAMELRVNGEVRQTRQHRADAHLHPAPGRVPLGAGLLAPATSSPPARSRASPRSSRTRSTSTCSPGDGIEAEIEGVGVLRNHVVPWGDAHGTPPYSTDLYSSTG